MKDRRYGRVFGLLLLSLIILSTSMELEISASSFNYQDEADISSWAIDSVRGASEEGIISGSNGKFHPKKDITRAEFTKIIMEALDLDTDKELNYGFKDVKKGDWYYSYVLKAYKMGIISGYDGSFRPNDPITREEMAVILSRSVEDHKDFVFESDGEEKFLDQEDIAVWSSDAVKKLSSQGIMTAYEGRFQAREKVSREMATVSIMRLRSLLETGEIQPESQPESHDELIKKSLERTGEKLYKTVDNPTVGSTTGDWAVFGLARAGINPGDSYFENYQANVEKYLKDNSGKLHSSRYTEYSRLILAMTSIGGDVENLADYNLLENLTDLNNLKRQGINGPIFTLLALDSGDYEIPINSEAKEQTSREKLIDFLLERELESGGWSLRSKSEKADVDVTAMTIQSLAPYYNKDERVKLAIDKAIEILSTNQEKSGGYSSMGEENAESSAQVIVALTTMGIDPYKDERFIEGGRSVVDALLDYELDSAGFAHIKSGSFDMIATNQAMYALVAYDRFLNNMTSLYDMSDLE